MALAVLRAKQECLGNRQPPGAVRAQSCGRELLLCAMVSTDSAPNACPVKQPDQSQPGPPEGGGTWRIPTRVARPQLRYHPNGVGRKVGINTVFAVPEMVVAQPLPIWPASERGAERRPPRRGHPHHTRLRPPMRCRRPSRSCLRARPRISSAQRPGIGVHDRFVYLKRRSGSGMSTPRPPTPRW